MSQIFGGSDQPSQAEDSTPPLEPQFGHTAARPAIRYTRESPDHERVTVAPHTTHPTRHATGHQTRDREYLINNPFRSKQRAASIMLWYVHPV